jgi:hypothetical protein
VRWPHGKSGGLVDPEWKSSACDGAWQSSNNDTGSVRGNSS